MESLLLRKGKAMAQEDSDLQKIKDLIEIMKDNELVEVEIKHGDDKIFLKRSQPQQPPITAVPVVTPNISAVPQMPFDASGTKAAFTGPNAAAHSVAEAGPSSMEPQPEENLLTIKSPVVGTFYMAPSPDSDTFVEPGSHVEPQTVVCVIEAMKVMNEIKAELSGTITEISVTNGQAVEYGQVLFKVRPD